MAKLKKSTRETIVAFRNVAFRNVAFRNVAFRNVVLACVSGALAFTVVLFKLKKGGVCWLFKI